MGYQWQWNPGKEGVSDDWQPCSGADTATLTIQNVQNSSEGSYCCVISNCAGSQTSKPANLAGEDSVSTNLLLIVRNYFVHFLTSTYS